MQKNYRTTPISRPHDDEDSFPVICDRELHSLHRNIPALRRRDMDTATIKQHYYPEGGWGWLVCGAAFLAHLLTSGIQLAFGLLYLYTMKYMVKKNDPDREFYAMATAWMGALSISISLISSPIILAISRRKSTRLAALFGGLILTLSCLFTSFATQFHQTLLSYGLMLGLGSGLVRETSCLTLGHYFKRRREFVEMISQTGSGIGIALVSVLYKEGVGKLGWRLGLQSLTGLLALSILLPIVYRSANLYHPQRRAIMHLKNQRKKVKEKKGCGQSGSGVRKPKMFDFSPLKSRGLRILLVSSSSAGLGMYAPIIFLVYQGYKEGLEEPSLVLLQTFLGFSSALGCFGFGLVTIKPSTQCLISRQYLCQASLIGIGISLLALTAVQGYHGYCLFTWLYGICLGGYTYSLKMFTLERVKTRHFTKAWSFIESSKSVPILIGIPLTGFINQNYPKYGYYFSFFSTLAAAFLMFLVGNKKDVNLTPKNVNFNHLDHFNNLNNLNTLNLNECICSLANFNHFNHINPYNLSYNNHYEQIFDEKLHRSSLKRKLSHKNKEFLKKSRSYAANMERFGPHDPNIGGFLKYNVVNRNNLRPSKSFPEGLGRNEYFYGSFRHQRPLVRNVQVIEQITTSV
nr:monocarboxylate transporter 2-like [Onthophagus taurus]